MAVGDIPDIPGVGRLGGEIPLEQIRHLLVGRIAAPVGVVLVVHDTNPLGQSPISSGPCSAGVGSGALGVERRSCDLHDRTHPFHLKGVGAVGDELEAADQLVSQVKYLVADRRRSRSGAQPGLVRV